MCLARFVDFSFIIVSNRWFQVELDRAVPRLAHSSTQVGSYLFVIGGHDGTRYSNEVLLLNLGKEKWSNHATKEETNLSSYVNSDNDF